MAAGHPPPEFEERAGNVVVRFIPKGYVPPHRVEHNLTERQSRILHALRDGRPHRAADIRAVVDPDLAKRSLTNDLTLLKAWGLIRTAGQGAGTRWMLV